MSRPYPFFFFKNLCKYLFVFVFPIVIPFSFSHAQHGALIEAGVQELDKYSATFRLNPNFARVSFMLDKNNSDNEPWQTTIKHGDGGSDIIYRSRSFYAGLEAYLRGYLKNVLPLGMIFHNHWLKSVNNKVVFSLGLDVGTGKFTVYWRNTETKRPTFAVNQVGYDLEKAIEFIIQILNMQGNSSTPLASYLLTIKKMSFSTSLDAQLGSSIAAYQLYRFVEISYAIEAYFRSLGEDNIADKVMELIRDLDPNGVIKKAEFPLVDPLADTVAINEDQRDPFFNNLKLMNWKLLVEVNQRVALKLVPLAMELPEDSNIMKSGFPLGALLNRLSGFYSIREDEYPFNEMLEHGSAVRLIDFLLASKALVQNQMLQPFLQKAYELELDIKSMLTDIPVIPGKLRSNIKTMNAQQTSFKRSPLSAQQRFIQFW